MLNLHKPAKPVNRAGTTTVRVVVRGEYKRRRKGQQTLFNAEGVLVTRTFDSDGMLIGYKAVPIRNYRRLV